MAKIAEKAWYIFARDVCHCRHHGVKKLRETSRTCMGGVSQRISWLASIAVYRVYRPIPRGSLSDDEGNKRKNAAEF